LEDTLLGGTRNIKSVVLSLESQAGLTLVELIFTVAIVAILSLAALPLARVTIQREREVELRRNLREIREAIDRSKDAQTAASSK
jgi:general secretion pathway protein G